MGAYRLKMVRAFAGPDGRISSGMHEYLEVGPLPSDSVKNRQAKRRCSEQFTPVPARETRIGEQARPTTARIRRKASRSRWQSLPVENDTVYYRVSDRLYSASILSKGIGAAQLIAKDHIICDFNWAFIKG